MRYVFLGIFLVASAILLYYISISISRPVNFNKTWAERKVVVHKQLDDIVELQKMYKSLHNDTAYAGSFDDMLTTFLKDSFSILRIDGDPYDTLKKPDTIRMNLSAKDSICGYLVKVGYLKSDEYNQNKSNNSFVESKVKEYITKMRFVPFSENKSKNLAAKEFEIKSSEITLEGSRMSGNYKQPTFEVSTQVGVYMSEFEPKEFSMYNPEFDPKVTIKVGDLNKITTAFSESGKKIKE